MSCRLGARSIGVDSRPLLRREVVGNPQQPVAKRLFTIEAVTFAGVTQRLGRPGSTDPPRVRLVLSLSLTPWLGRRPLRTHKSPLYGAFSYGPGRDRTCDLGIKSAGPGSRYMSDLERGCWCFSWPRSCSRWRRRGSWFGNTRRIPVAAGAEAMIGRPVLSSPRAARPGGCVSGASPGRHAAPRGLPSASASSSTRWRARRRLPLDRTRRRAARIAARVRGFERGCVSRW